MLGKCSTSELYLQPSRWYSDCWACVFRRHLFTCKTDSCTSLSGNMEFYPVVWMFRCMQKGVDDCASNQSLASH
jgi:hypothetical protein